MQKEAESQPPHNKLSKPQKAGFQQSKQNMKAYQKDDYLGEDLLSGDFSVDDSMHL